MLGINLLFDGLTNSTQDYIFQTFRGYTGPQMMAANNLLGSVITGGYLVLSPWLVATPLGEWFGNNGETFSETLGFVVRQRGGDMQELKSAVEDEEAGIVVSAE